MIGSAIPISAQAARNTVISARTPITRSIWLGSPARKSSGSYSTHW